MKKDKLIFLLGFTLLGYYLGISLFSSIIRSFLEIFLPPIDTRFLPEIYPGLLGALILGLLVYIFFNRAHRKKQLIGIALLVLVPLLIGGAFRIHSVSWINKAEKTIPTDIRISFERENNSLMFATSPNSATGISTRYIVEKENLPHWGEMLKNMELKELKNRGEIIDNSSCTLWINYRPDGHWYNKILVFTGGVFYQSVANVKIAVFSNPALAKEMEKIKKDIYNLYMYTEASLIKSAEEVSNPLELSPEMFNKLKSTIQNSPSIEPTEKIKERLNKSLIEEDEKNIYGINLANKNGTENFMVYDATHKILRWGDRYYKLDINEYLN